MGKILEKKPTIGYGLGDENLSILYQADDATLLTNNKGDLFVSLLKMEINRKIIEQVMDLKYLRVKISSNYDILKYLYKTTGT